MSLKLVPKPRLRGTAVTPEVQLWDTLSKVRGIEKDQE
jgi:hypothetical protein